MWLSVCQHVTSIPNCQLAACSAVCSAAAAAAAGVRYEGQSPAGSHKPNTAVPQAYYNKIEGEAHTCPAEVQWLVAYHVAQHTAQHSTHAYTHKPLHWILNRMACKQHAWL